MNAYVLLGLNLVIFLFLQNYWKSKGALVFLLLCAGNILSSSVSGNVSTVIVNSTQNQSLPIAQVVKILFLIGPPILGIILTKGAAKKKHLLLNIGLGIVSAALAYLWLIRTLNYEQLSLLESQNISARLLEIRDYIVGAGVTLSLLFILLDKKKKEKHSKSKKD
jgi:hypothetical protein